MADPGSYPEKEKPRFCRAFEGALGRTRTCDLLIRSQALYPAELRARGALLLYRCEGVCSRGVLRGALWI